MHPTYGPGPLNWPSNMLGAKFFDFMVVEKYFGTLRKWGVSDSQRNPISVGILETPYDQNFPAVSERFEEDCHLSQ